MEKSFIVVFINRTCTMRAVRLTLDDSCAHDGSHSGVSVIHNPRVYCRWNRKPNLSYSEHVYI